MPELKVEVKKHIAQPVEGKFTVSFEVVLTIRPIDNEQDAMGWHNMVKDWIEKSITLDKPMETVVAQ
jgi:hypothetical protein